ncbi:hypothetical protein [Acinetobacter gyllenbergii]|uniref:hypothetical protein n=1 Tax=Acinetobacter gyllenbergii TaxID=134534 RepID=UPI0008069757|nr:hypothetical protein [Acinetobacter gyllenbergii]OBY75891.1 hypothetical protein NG55_04260 [Acinetobacter gyllenbergii]
MASDVDVQFFTHLNGLVLSNNWGDMCRMLDICLVNGLALPSVTAASVDAQGDINLTFFAAHNSSLFQIVELSGFSPSEINAKYRIKGVPSTTQLILKAEHAGKTITASGSAKLPSFGYDLIFRDSGDVKRVYRAKNPRAEHPFIRVDETISDGVNSYNSAYAKSAMVGLIENMTHIDDYNDNSKLQLPLDTTDLAKNWKITGTGANVVKGWARWHWAGGDSEASTQITGNRLFSIVGNRDAFYLSIEIGKTTANSSNNFYRPTLLGCGLFETSLTNDVIPNWFLMSYGSGIAASSTTLNMNRIGQSTLPSCLPLFSSSTHATFFTPKYSINQRFNNHVLTNGIMPDFRSGYTNNYPANQVSALEIPINDNDGYLRGTLKHVCYAGKNITGLEKPAFILSEKSMYLATDQMALTASPYIGGLYFYLGELS